MSVPEVESCKYVHIHDKSQDSSVELSES